MAAPKMPNGGMKNKGRGAYVDRDKPAQIRFSNISAGKGKLQIQYSYFVVGWTNKYLPLTLVFASDSCCDTPFANE